MPGSRPVLLVMDFQHGIVESIAEPSVVDAASRAVKAARVSGIPVMFVRVAFRPGYPEAAASNAAFGAICCLCSIQRLYCGVTSRVERHSGREPTFLLAEETAGAPVPPAVIGLVPSDAAAVPGGHGDGFGKDS